MNDKRAVKALNAALEDLNQYFDTVQIFVSKNQADDQTVGQTIGSGNLFARIGQIGMWLSQIESTFAAGGESEEIEDEGDDEI